jgi:hypothetical protein
MGSQRKYSIEKKLVCECGKQEFDIYYEGSEKGPSDNYVFFATCKKCGSHWTFTAVVPRSEISYKNPRFSGHKKIENKKR